MAEGGNHEDAWHDISEPTANYVGRDKEHKCLDDLHLKWLITNSLFYAAITGLGGVGKSEIAINFALQFRSKSEEDDTPSNCIWINAETKDSQLSSFQSLAWEFQLPTVDDKGNPKALYLLVKELYQIISQKRSLLILDNIETYEDPIFRILDGLAKKLDRKNVHPFVIITSRSIRVNEFFGAKAKHIQLSNLPWRSAKEFLRKSLNVKPENSLLCLKELCERLDRLPLALHAAVAVINKGLQYKSSVEHEVMLYLKEYEKLNQNTLDSKLPILEKPNSSTIFRIWQVTLDRIKNTGRLGEIANDVMVITAFLSSFDVKISLLKEILKTFPNNNENEDEDVQQAINIVADFSMCTINRKEETISVHRVVQDVIRAYCRHFTNDYEAKLDHLLTIVSKESFINHKSVTLSQLAHLRSLWNYTMEYPKLAEKHFKLPPLIAEKYILYSRYDECLSFVTDEVEKIFETIFGNDSRNTLWILYWKACALDKNGKYQQSREILLKCHDNQKKFLGHYDDHTLRSSQVIGSTYWHEGILDEAMEWFQKTLRIRTEYFKDHEQTLVLKNNTALALIDQGEPQQGLDMMKELLEIKKQNLGSNHLELEMLIAKHNVAWARFCLAEYGEAEEILTEVIEEKRNSSQIGPNHVETTNSMHLLAKTLKKMEKYSEAIEIAKKTFALRETLLGLNHPQTKNTKELIEELERAL